MTISLYGVRQPRPDSVLMTRWFRRYGFFSGAHVWRGIAYVLYLALAGEGFGVCTHVYHRARPEPVAGLSLASDARPF